MTKKKEIKKSKEKKLDPAFKKAIVLAASQSKEIDISLIDLTGWNLRGEDSFKDEEFEQLKQSMKENGFFKHEPLLVRPVGDRFQLIAGHRRLRAAQDLNFEVVPVSIRDINDQDAKLLIFIDNLHRKDFSPLEEAAGIKQVLDDGAITQTELAAKMGKSQAYIANRLRLLDAPEELKKLIISQEITPSHVNLLLPFAGYPVFKDIIASLKNILKVRTVAVSELESIISRIFNGYDGKKSVLNLDSFEYENRRVHEFFDFEKCKDCKDIILIKNYSEENQRRCLNQDCWSAKLAAAQKKYELAEEKKSQNLLKKDKVDITKMSYGTYKVLRADSWDQTACSSCDKCKKDKKDLVCLDVKCFDKKEKAFQKEKQKLAEENELKAWELCDKRLVDVTVLDIKLLRGLLQGILDSNYYDPGEHGFSPWADSESEDDFDISKIPDEDIPKALIRILIAEKLEFHNPTVETMEKYLVELGI